MCETLEKYLINISIDYWKKSLENFDECLKILMKIC